MWDHVSNGEVMVGQGTGGLGKVCEGVRCGDGWPGGLWVAVGCGVGMSFM
jgi:hypothetical protein